MDILAGRGMNTLGPSTLASLRMTHGAFRTSLEMIGTSDLVLRYVLVIVNAQVAR